MKRRPQPKPDFDELIPLLISAWRRLSNIKGGPSDALQTREFRGVVDSILSLNKGLEETQDFVGKDYFKDRTLLGAYLLYHWILHYAQGLSLLEELPSPPRRVLDICSGPAAFAYAALKHGAEEVYAIDQNLDALNLGAQICGKSGHTLTIRPWKAHQDKLPVEGKFDLITMGYCLEELFPKHTSGWLEKQQSFTRSLLNLLTPDGHLLLVESSWPHTNQRMLRLRDGIVGEGIAIQAPCVWKGQCPALQAANSPCYAQRPFQKPYLISEIQRAAKINLSSLKMSYLIIKSPEASWPAIPDQPVYRIVSPPVDSLRGKRFYLCGTDGKKSLGSRLADHPAESKAFNYLQRGDLIAVEGALNTKDLMEVVQETKVYIRAACGKALPEKI